MTTRLPSCFYFLRPIQSALKEAHDRLARVGEIPKTDIYEEYNLEGIVHQEYICQYVRSGSPTPSICDDKDTSAILDDGDTILFQRPQIRIHRSLYEEA